jgi:phosphoglucosamine mutase
VNDRKQNRKLFGTDGVRGVANRDLTPALAYRLGRSVVHAFFPSRVRPAILVARDTRLSGDLIEWSFGAGVMSAGGDVHRLDVFPTGALAWLTKETEYTIGTMISASHNPAEDNGIKFFNGDGYKISREQEELIEQIYFHEHREIGLPVNSQVGRCRERLDLRERYIESLCSQFAKADFDLRVVMDCAHGAAYEAAPELFRRLGFDVIAVNCSPSGERINVDCGSTNLEPLKKLVLENKADFGIAFDGDADRAKLVCEKGNEVNGDHIIGMWANHLLSDGHKKQKRFVGTVLSNTSLELEIGRRGGTLLRADVGDSNVLKLMLSEGARIGGEQSGHMIFLDHSTTGDGLLTALKVAELMKCSGKQLSELAAIIDPFPQLEINIETEHKDFYLTDDVIQQEIARVSESLNGNGRLLVRPSGTQPLLRLMLEARDLDLARSLGGELKARIEERLPK